MPDQIADRDKSPRHRGEHDNVFSIPPGAPFLRTLAEFVVKGDFTKSQNLASDPLALAHSVIFVPTRRAARGLGVEILEVAQRELGLKSVILPRIRTIGDLDEEELLLGLDGENIDVQTSLGGGARVIEPVERHLSLALLTQNWASSLSPETQTLLDHEQIALPSSASDALFLSQELAKFMDQIEAEEADWDSIKNIVGDNDFSHWWQLTLDFLRIVMEAWPRFLNAGNLINPAAFRNEVINFRIKELSRNPASGFVLAAGTTGSVPATSRLLTAIKNMPNGAIILPGLDKDLPQNIIKRFCDMTELTHESVSSTHPQYGLVTLLQKLNTGHQEVIQLGAISGSLTAREKILNTVLLPAEDSQIWVSAINDYSAEEIFSAFENVAVIEAASEYDEALAIALLLREALEQQNKTAALVTPDRKLARRVSTELERFGIQIDDSAGEALLASKPVSFLRQLLRVVFGDNDRISLSSFLKNDLIVLGAERLSIVHKLELLELVIVRNSLGFPDLANLAKVVEDARKIVENTNHAPHQLKNLDDEKWDDLAIIAGKISEALKELLTLSTRRESITPAELSSHLKQAAKALSSDEALNNFMFEETGGQELLALLDAYGLDHGTEFSFESFEAPNVFDALIAGKRTRKVGRTRSRLHIYGTLEARLQTSDLLVLGSLNEGNWPQRTDNDPYLNRPMRSHLNLPLPERRIGLAAHDFSQFSGALEVVYTRSQRVDEAPSIASRWLQRLKTFLGEEQTSKLTARGKVYLELAKQLDQSTTSNFDLKQPAPTPPVSARPQKLSITEIETWIRDPYAIYAKHILKLRPLPPIIRLADPALRGTIYHNMLAGFIETWRGKIDQNAAPKLAEIADEEFASHNLPEEIGAIWRPRFTSVGDGFLAWQQERWGNIKESHCEIELRGEIGKTGFQLHGRADRIDVNLDGSLAIIDYKTGSNPTKAQARTFSPQLALEGALALKGCAKNMEPGPISELLYVRLREKEKFAADDIAQGKDKNGKALDAGELCQSAYDELINHINAYQNDQQGYVSQYAPLPNKGFEGDFDHLARIKEWSLAENDNEEAGE